MIVAIRVWCCASCLCALLPTAAYGEYEANWASLDARPVPQWWKDAKFGIFVHWGPYSVPAFAPTPRLYGSNWKDGKKIYSFYAEWYQGQLDRSNELVRAYHLQKYGSSPYANFAAAFRAENFNAAEWADLFRRAGARYAVLTAKHHDGYALWPSAETPYYNSVALGSGRDLVGEFATAMKAAGLKRGFYYSLMEYANPNYPMKTREATPTPEQRERVRKWARNVNIPQMEELVEKYGADILWPDGEWYYSDRDYLSGEFLAWLYNESTTKDMVVVNDRWGSDSRGKHGGHLTTEYGAGPECIDGANVRPWEECRGIGRSFGFNRMETSEDYMTPEECIETLVDVASRGGNLLLNVGPTADGRIPAIMQDRLLAMGRWLETNGEAIYGSTHYAKADRELAKKGVYFTERGNSVYVISMKWPEAPLRVTGLGSVDAVSLLGGDERISWCFDNDVLSLEPPPSRPKGQAYGWTFKIQRRKQ